MSFEKISVPTVREEFVRSIENKILSGELKPGDKLPPARELCSLMGVSLTTVSTGLTELANKGFLEIKPRHGAYVADYLENATPETFIAILRYNGGKLNAHEVRSFTESRIASDPFVARLAAERATDEQLAELRPLCDRFSECESIADACDAITAWCYRMYQLSDNTIFSLMYKMTIDAQKGMYALYFKKNGIDQVKELTSEVTEALLRRDGETAGKILFDSMRGVISGSTSII